MDSDIRFSNILSKTLDSLGYSYSAIQRRINHYNHYFENNTRLAQYQAFCRNINGECILAGSKREGISLSMESDLDVMFVFTILSCFDKLSKKSGNLDLQMNNEPFGYAKLTVHDHVEMPIEYEEELDALILKINSDYFLPSEYLMTCLDPKLYSDNYKLPTSATWLPRSGPSYPSKFTNIEGFNTYLDIVAAIPCVCSEYLKAWICRKRFYGFPTQKTISAVSKLSAHVVPVGYKYSHDQFLQWRICYTLAEIQLIQQFNPVQYKIYVLLKMLSKNRLRNDFPFLTSYVMKNIVLWISEVTPQRHFVDDRLSRMLVRAILFLRKCVCEGFLPNYMIPKRNLFVGNILPYVKHQLKHELLIMADESGSMALACPNIAREIVILYKNPESYRARIRTRTTMEKLFMIDNNYFSSDNTIGSRSVREVKKETISARDHAQMFLTWCEKDPQIWKTMSRIMLNPQVLNEILRAEINPNFIDIMKRGLISLLNPHMIRHLMELFESPLFEQEQIDTHIHEYIERKGINEDAINIDSLATEVALSLVTPEKVKQIIQTGFSHMGVCTELILPLFKYVLKCDTDLNVFTFTNQEQYLQTYNQACREIEHLPVNTVLRDYIEKHLSGESI